VHVVSVFDSPTDPPIERASEILAGSGYEHRQKVVTKLYAAEWQMITPDDRRTRSAA
jgi:hypothetical protein